MNLSRLLPQSAKNVSEKKIDNLLYTAMVDWGWSWDDFLNTPIPVVIRLLKKHEEVIKKQNKGKK